MPQVTSNRPIENSDVVSNMTRLIFGNSLAVNQLSIWVDGLEHRLELVEIQLGTPLWDVTWAKNSPVFANCDFWLVRVKSDVSEQSPVVKMFMGHPKGIF